jgi:hypothetical protein
VVYPASLWEALNTLMDSLGGLSADEAMSAVIRHVGALKDVEM